MKEYSILKFLSETEEINPSAVNKLLLGLLEEGIKDGHFGNCTKTAQTCHLCALEDMLNDYYHVCGQKGLLKRYKLPFDAQKFTQPFRIGKKQNRSVLDSKGLEVVVFPKGLEVVVFPKGLEVVVFPKGLEGMADSYCNYLNSIYII